MGNSVPSISGDVSETFDAELQLISDSQAAPPTTDPFSVSPRLPPALTVSLQTAGNPLSVPPVSRPGMINSLPMTSRAKCRPAVPPSFTDFNRPRSLLFDPTSQSSSRPTPLNYEHLPPAPGEKRMKTAHENAGHSSATGLLRTKIPSTIPFLVNLWTSILNSLVNLSKVFTDIGTHANFSSLASVILDAFAVAGVFNRSSAISLAFGKQKA